ncbi:hypothetical protein H6F74_23555 [Trichocoleus sp. FACHB-90]|uniref:hypothetical protein n=1 Tax=Cyanophyceae TaxID=3028117 RepID=UPI0016835A45|nr:MULTISPECIES: hypothetical protein [unclassified Trichocoleus]MBD1929195.1 hypothetical protein [Trichocoleus sp. FACHB-90]
MSKRSLLLLTRIFLGRMPTTLHPKPPSCPNGIILIIPFIIQVKALVSPEINFGLKAKVS